MGDLNKLCTDVIVKNYKKYLIFIDIPINLVLWGCAIWAIHTFLLRKLEVFLHSSIRRILHIKIYEVKEQRIKNETVRESVLTYPTSKNIWHQNS